MNTRSAIMANKRSALKELPIPENILAPPRGSSKPNAKKKLKVIKTSSFVESFPGRLDWKRRHFEKPVTSTPTTSSLKSVFTQDVEKCFGFDEDSDREENYSSLISPIPKNVDHLSDKNSKDIYLNDKDQAKAATRSSGRSSCVKENPPVSPSYYKPATTKMSSNFGAAGNVKEMSVPPSSCEPTRNTRNSGKTSKAKDLPGIVSTCKPTKPVRGYGKTSKVKEVALADCSPQAKNVPSVKEDVPVIATPSSKLTNFAIATASKTNKLFESIKSTCKKPLKSRFKVKAGKKKVVIRQPDFDSSVQLDEASEPYMVLQPTDIGNDGVKVKNFAELLERYNFDEKEEEEFRIDPKRATVTYPGKRNSHDVQCFDFELPTKKRKTKTIKSKKGTKKASTKGFVPQPLKKGTGNKKDGDELDAATREWLEMKNKEFQDILKVNLIVE